MSIVQRVLERAMLKQNGDRLPAVNGTFGSFGSNQPTGQMAQLSSMGAVAWVFATVNRIAQSMAAQNWKLYRVQGNDRTEVTDHPALRLWLSANPYITREDFIETSQQHIELTGEMWWILIRNSLGIPVEMQVVRPDRMRPIPHPSEFIAGYEYRLGAQSIPLEREDVIFTRTPNPLDPYRGIGVVQSLMVDIGAEKAAAEWMYNFFKQDATPGGIIEVDSNLQDADFARLAERWRSQHQGVGNAHRVAILERATWKSAHLTQRDMQFEALRRFSRDQILGAFGMPLAVMGITESVNRANAQAAELLYARWLIRPRLMRIKSALNQKLLRLYPDGDSLEFDFIDPVPDDRIELLTEATSGYEKGILSLNEARRRLHEQNWEGPEGDELKPQGAPPPQMSLEEFGYKPRPRRSMKVADNEQYPTVGNDIADRIERGWIKRFNLEIENILAHLGATEKSITKITPQDLDSYDWDWWAKYGDDVIEELSESFSIILFSEMPDIAPSRVVVLAQEYALNYAGLLLQGDSEFNVTKSTRLRVAELVAENIEKAEPLQKLRAKLRDDFQLGAKRAQRIARTETARALGNGQLQVAKEEGKSEKRWLTLGDILVSQEICGANEDEGWVPINYLWQGLYDTIPGHINCRCVVQYRQAPLAAEEADALYPRPRRDAPTPIIKEVRCPQCNRKAGENIQQGTSMRCRRCKQTWEVSL